jgi:hypothetical protein
MLFGRDCGTNLVLSLSAPSLDLMSIVGFAVVGLGLMLREGL